MQTLDLERFTKTHYVRKSIISIGIIAFFIAMIVAFIMSNRIESKVSSQ